MSNANHTDDSPTGITNATTPNAIGPISSPHALSSDAVLVALNSSLHGLTQSEAVARLEQYGRNTLPQARLPSIGTVFLRQFASPLIYVLVAAALLSLLIKEWSDAGLYLCGSVHKCCYWHYSRVFRPACRGCAARTHKHAMPSLT